jgi:selenocysteine-specific elongation factor
VKSIVVGTAGHIDHGKSALVRALTGTDPDRLKEEKARGITIDLGFAHLDLAGLTLAFVDVPGHERFVKNMLAGAGGIDAVILVVAADESIMPQTREHFEICRLLRVPAGVVVLTKSDLADADMRALAAMEVRELVAGSFLDGAPIVEVSSKTGEGLDELRRVLAEVAAWIPGRTADGPVRLPIDRVFSIRGFGTVVTGTLVSGALTADRDAVVLPPGRAVKIRGLQVHGEAATTATAGHRVAVNLGGVDVAELARGETLCTPGAFEPTRRFDATVDLLATARPLRHGARVRFHQGTTELLGRVAIGSLVGRQGGPSEIPAGGSAFTRVRLEAPAVLTRGDRFILRAYSPPITIGGGIVLDPHPPRSAIRNAVARARFEQMAGGAEDAILAFLGERQGAGLARVALGSRAGLTAAEADGAVARLVARGQVRVIGDVLAAPEVLRSLSERLLTALKAHHAAEPLSEGLPREEAREKIFGRAAPAVFDHVVASLVGEQKIVARDRLALAGHALALSPEEANARDALARIYRDAALAPPDLAAAAAAAAISATVADRVTRLMLRQKTLVRLDTLLFHADALAKLKTEIVALKAGGTQVRVDVASFKERYGITRKFAIPLLEYLDRERVTRRMGDARIVL